jgi:transcriptional regulator with XRE-family HTH domain
MDKMLITKELSKGARGLKEWSARDLSEKSGVALDTIKSFESGRTKALSAHNQDAVQKALELAGIQFLEADETALGVGVALNGG